MKPIDKVINATNQVCCIWCHSTATEIEARELMKFTSTTGWFCYNPKLISAISSMSPWPCLKSDWDGCPFNK